MKSEHRRRSCERCQSGVSTPISFKALYSSTALYTLHPLHPPSALSHLGGAVGVRAGAGCGVRVCVCVTTRDPNAKLAPHARRSRCALSLLMGPDAAPPLWPFHPSSLTAPALRAPAGPSLLVPTPHPPSPLKERKKTDNPNEGWGRRTGSTPARAEARAGFWKDDQGHRWALLLLTRDTTGSQRGARWNPNSTGGLISV